MTPNRDLSELFRQQVPNKVQERPAPGVWRRLQHRLDAYDRWHKYALRVSTQLVLFFLLLIAIVAPMLIGISIEEQKRAEMRNPPVLLQVLSPLDTVANTRQFLELTSEDAEEDTIFIQIEN